LNRNELDLTFWVPNYGAKYIRFTLKLIENCDRTRVDRQTDETDTGDFMICPMLCYSNGTDSNYPIPVLLFPTIVIFGPPFSGLAFSVHPRREPTTKSWTYTCSTRNW